VTEATPTSRALALIARGLTLSRVALLPPFLWLMYVVATSPSLPHRVAIAGCYGFIASSDALDGRLARRARAAVFAGRYAAFKDDVMSKYRSGETLAPSLAPGPAPAGRPS